jgi:hypothetical protein
VLCTHSHLLQAGGYFYTGAGLTCHTNNNKKIQTLAPPLAIDTKLQNKILCVKSLTFQRNFGKLTCQLFTRLITQPLSLVLGQSRRLQISQILVILPIKLHAGSIRFIAGQLAAYLANLLNCVPCS